MNQELPKSLKVNNLIFFIIKWRKAVAIVTILAGISAFIFSMPYFVKPKFNSVVLLYPSTTNSLSRALFNFEVGKQDILEFGDEVEAEHLLQILTSDQLRDRIIKKYNLMSHYQIDSTSSYPKTRLNNEYENNISASRTEYMSVKISVLDTDPVVAANIANDMASTADSIRIEIQHSRANEGLKIIEEEYKTKVKFVAQLEDSLKWLRKNGIFEYTTQVKILNEEYEGAVAYYTNESGKYEILSKMLEPKDTAVINTKARVNGGLMRKKLFEGKLSNYAKYGGANISLTEVLKDELKDLAFLKTKYERSMIDANQSISHNFIVDKATVAEKKSSPLRGLIVIIAMASAFFMSLLAIVFIENRHHFKADNQGGQIN